jgi:hypothetical protein
MFIRGNPEAAGGFTALLQHEHNHVINRVASGWVRPKGFDRGTIISADKPADLPAAILRQADAQNVPHEEIKGVLHNGHDYLIRKSFLRDARDAELTIFHEAFSSSPSNVLRSWVVSLDKSLSLSEPAFSSKSSIVLNSALLSNFRS